MRVRTAAGGPSSVASRAPRSPQGYPPQGRVVQDDQVQPRLVTTDDWPEPELRAAVLAGELVAVGPCWASPAEPQTPALRAEAVSWALGGRRLVACALTAAWIWGAVSRPPDPLEVCFPPHGRGRIDPTLRLREARLADGELLRLGSLPVTTPLRTAVDLLRTADFTAAEHVAVTGLLGTGAVGADELRAHLRTLGVVPMIRQAERRLRAVEQDAADR